MTNKEWLATLPAEKWWETVKEQQLDPETAINLTEKMTAWLEEEHPFTREQKEAEDRKSLENYEERLKRTAKAKSQQFSAFAINQRKSRAAAIGECALQALDAVYALNKKTQLQTGTLVFLINENKVEDPDGKKGFQCSVTYRVVSYEPAYTEEEIREMVEDTRRKMAAETEEMFPEEEAPTA